MDPLDEVDEAAGVLDQDLAPEEEDHHPGVGRGASAGGGSPEEPNSMNFLSSGLVPAGPSTDLRPDLVRDWSGTGLGQQVCLCLTEAQDSFNAGLAVFYFTLGSFCPFCKRFLCFCFCHRQ